MAWSMRPRAAIRRRLANGEMGQPQFEVLTMPASIKRTIQRRGLSRVEAAMYLGISPSKFDELRKAGQIGPAKIIGTRKLFDVEILDQFFDALPDENSESGDWTVAA